MAVRSDRERLREAWNALALEDGGQGWRTISIRPQESRRLLAGRHFPGNEEAVLVGFANVGLPADGKLPQGRGFRVERLPGDALPGGHAYVAMYRQSHASVELFSLMAEDVIALLDNHINAHDRDFLQLFLGRIRAWQAFMHEARHETLGPAAELGLAGELLVASRLLDAGIRPMAALDAWEGPIGGLHDFRLGLGALEVKSTAAAHGFPAAISSMDQLDPVLTAPLFLAAVRFRVGPKGLTLPEMAADVAARVDDVPGAAATLETLLLRAGYLRSHAARYDNRFEEVTIRFILVDSTFPGLHRGCVESAVTRLQYEIDLDLVPNPDWGLGETLRALGAMK